ncbi:MAG: EAL domain-containing protein [Rhodoferax sp.]|nr:EAL domain-containing protein [Rhodoferax sp.]
MVLSSKAPPPPHPAQTTLGDILVVDDSHASRQALVTLLGNAGYSVREAPNGELALWSMARRVPDLIMLDVRMPGMSGFDVCRSIRQQTNTATVPVPVIFITDVADMDDTLEGFDAGGTDFISKPISDVETLARVRTHITMAQAAKQLLAQHSTASDVQQQAQPTTAVEDNTRPAEILVVEDTPISLLLLGTILRMAGYVVREATNGELALWSATKRTPDLILLDIRMPGMNGFDVCRCLKFDPATAHVPVIFISALTEAQDKAAGFAVGAVDFIAKPFDGKEVLARVQAHLRLARASTPAKSTLPPPATQNKGKDVKPQTTEFDRAFAASVNAIALTDAKGTILALNPAFSQLTGYPVEEVRSTPLMDLLARHAKSPLANTWPDLRKQGSWSTQARLLKRDQSYIVCQVSMSALQDFDGHTAPCVVVLQDISLKPPKESLVDFLAHFDPHTGLPNRALAQSRFSTMKIAAQAQGDRIVVCVIRFTLPPGTLAISDLSRKIAARLTPLLDAADTLYREDQQHFVLLHTQSGESSDDFERAVRVANQINTDTHWPEKPPGLHASIGLAFSPQDGDTLAALIEAGKISIEYAAPGSSIIGTSALQYPDFDIECALRSALLNHEFKLLYQPLFALQDGPLQSRIVGAEALLRWKVPNLGYIPLERLLRVAEETGEIVAIGAWVIRSVCAQVKLWEPRLKNGFKVAINISSLQFWQDGLFTTIEEALRDSGIAPTRLEFDITEDTILEDETQATAILRRLKMLGVSLALDGFNPHRTDPDLLQSLPLDCLKVDQQKIGTMDADPNHAGLLKSIVELAHTLQLQAVAKGIERPEELQQIKDCHFDLAQGFLTARPIAADAFSPRHLC